MDFIGVSGIDASMPVTRVHCLGLDEHEFRMSHEGATEPASATDACAASPPRYARETPRFTFREARAGQR